MAYRLKIIHFQKKDCHIFLQNENGPCPLLAAANALLLRGAIDLPSHAIRAGAASIDDVVNVLAEYALLRHTSSTTTTTTTASTFEQHDNNHHLDELLSVFPTLQYGMDVNPKFNAGPTGVEYTSNLNAYDCLHVELVHGWLVDPQDTTTWQLIGNKTYNELIELVIQGNDASVQLERLSNEITDLTRQLELAKETKQQLQNTATNSTATTGEEGWVDVTPSAATATITSVDTNQAESSLEAGMASLAISTASSTAPSESLGEHDADLHIKVLADRLKQLRLKEREMMALSMKGMQIDHFLTTTSHQLTHFGLHELYAEVKDDELCVFFRNNHFATMTKHEGVLYLLVTDFGYANVPSVVWEKLDAIDGDTEYVSSNFTLPAPQPELLPSDVALTPEQLLAQQGQTEADYQLALKLSQNPSATIPMQRNLDEEEGRLMAAATEASLREYNGFASVPGYSGSTIVDTTIPSAPPDTDLVVVPPPPTQQQPLPQQQQQVPNPDSASTFSQEDADKALAMQLQEEWQNEVAARQIQEEEQRAAITRQTRPTNNNRPGATPTAPGRTASNSNCVIS